MGCCCAKDSEEEDKEQIVTRVRTQSRIPPLKKNTSYGSITEEEETSLEKSESTPHDIYTKKEEESKVSESLWTDKKPPAPPSSNKFFGKKTKSTEPPDPFQTGKKSKLKRAYATKGRDNKPPATKYAQSSPVLGKIKASQTQDTYSMSTTHETDSKRQEDIDLNRPYVRSGDTKPAATKHTQSSPVFERVKKAQMQSASSNNNSNDLNFNVTDANTIVSGNGFSHGSTKISESQEDIMGSETVSLSSSMSDMSSITGTLDLNQKPESMKMKNTSQGMKTKSTSKKTATKKISSKIGKFIPGKKKKKQETK